MEEQYVMGLRRLGQFKVPNAQSELGYVVSRRKLANDGSRRTRNGQKSLLKQDYC